MLFQTDGVKRILKLENNPELARDKHGKLHLAPEASENNSMLKFKPLSFMEARKAIKEHLMEVVDPADKTSIAGKVLDPKPINLKAFVKDSSSNGKSDVDVSKTTATPAPKPQPNTKSQQKHKAQHNQPQKTHKKKNKKNLSSDKKSK